ncbi:uncharacterized protein N7459_007855 [Penicillium hispanicum]|uniref:uncharacterized protein n=1 Tax=Penicillium hispanicum TaxID=1080232 RepID=UPI00253FBE6D|nr:uncharacterized protein N7459_007855 [Penicillium hispanicum]KAJ5573428.1 hypothetical protein N7459_007855 [Penicillium hispanicum]
MTAQSCVQDTHAQDLAFLPRDVFWLILAYLTPRDLVRCRRVSRAWNEAFGNPGVLIPLVKRHFPWTDEVKALNVSSGHLKTQEIRRLFDQVASRYDHLQRGKPRSVQRYHLCDDFGGAGDREWFQVQPWESHASHVRQFVDRQFSEALWTHEDGLLVFPSADHQCLLLMDLSNDRQFMVPFIIRGKVVRRVRLQRRLLVVEWAEPKAFHWLNDSDGVHRHFASSFEVEQNADDGWSIVPRNEWKIMFLGHPLSERDRFFSSHTNTHYVIYIWQPNRSLYTADEDAPIESLFVWDISRPSSYRPSLDPASHQTGPEVDQSPFIVARFGFRDLEFFGVRQRGCPSVQRIEVTEDGRAVEITENINTWLTIPDTLGLPLVITTSVPLQGHGPHRREKSELVLPPYRGNCSLQASPLSCMALLVECWYGIIAQVTDRNAGLSFCLHFDSKRWDDDEREQDQKDQTIKLTIQTMVSEVTRPNIDFMGRGKIEGCERYLLGENRNHELVIYRFDR